MKAWRLLVVLVLSALPLTASCFEDRVVGPEDVLPAVLAIDRPTVQLFRFARGRMVTADTVRISNNGEGTLGPVQQVGGVDYREGRFGWLRTRVENVGPNEALLILEPTYAEEEQEEADWAEVVLRGAGSPDLKRVTVLARTLRGASFEFSVSPLAFAAAPGDPPSSQLFTVRNGGNGTLVVHSPRVQYQGPGVDWLTVSRAGGSDAAPLFQVWADQSGLAGGLYRAQLVFESMPQEETRARPASLEVLLDVGQPRLGLSSPTLGFTVVRGEAPPPPQSVRISNVGAGAFSSLGAVQLGSVTYGQGLTGWLGADLQDGQVKVRVDPQGLPARDHAATFHVQSENGGLRAVQVSLSVEAPVLTTSTRSLSFGMVKGQEGLPPSQVVSLSNTGSGTGTSLGDISLGSLMPEVAWVGASVQERSLTVTPTASAAVLPVGSHVTRIPIHSAFGGSDTVTVTLSVSPGTDEAVLALSASEVSFRGVRGDPSPPPHTVRISNAGGGNLGAVTLGAVQYSGAAGWLSVSLADTALVLQAEMGSVPAGAHLATVPVSSAAGGSASVEVIFTVVSPVLTASASSASLSAVAGGAPGASREVLLSNTGPGTFSSLGTVSVGGVSYQSGSGWLGVSLSGTVLTLSLASVPASAGVYSANVPVSSAEGGSVTIKVELTVAPAPEAPRLVASPSQVRISAVQAGPPPPSQVILLSNGGGGSLGALGAQTSSPWLSLSLVGSEVTLTASPGGLAAGTYQAQVILTSAEGGQEDVEVTLVVGAPLLTLSSNSESFSAIQGEDALPASSSVFVSNGGAGDFSSLGALSLGAVSYSGPSGWLSATLPNGGATIQLGAGANGLGVGTYTATVPVNSTSGGSGEVMVTLSVTPQGTPPDLVLSSSTAFFTSRVGGDDPSPQEILLANAGGGGIPGLGGLTLGSVAYGAGASGWLLRSLADDRLTLQVTTGAISSGSYSASFSVTSAEGGSETVTVQFDVGAPETPPSLGLGSSEVGFAALEGSSDPPPRSIPVLNTGAGELGAVSLGAISYGAGASGWLDGSSANDSEVALVAATGSLGAGTFTATIPVNSVQGGSGSVSVTLTVAPVGAPAELVLSATDVLFTAWEGGGNPGSRTVLLANGGDGGFGVLGDLTLGAVDYGAGPSGWLDPSLIGDQLTLSVTTGAISAGTYSASLTVSSDDGGSEALTVVFSVRAPEAPPALGLGASGVELSATVGGSSPPSRVIPVFNTGSGTLGAVTLGPVGYGPGASGWLHGSSVDESGLTLSASTGSLSAGTYSASVDVTSQNGGSRTLNVNLVLGVPRLTLSSTSVSFSVVQGGGSPPGQVLSVRNTGVGSFSDLGTVTLGTTAYGPGASAWLGASSSGGDLELRAMSGGLTAGTYTATVPVTSSAGGGDAVSVTFTVARPSDAPALAVSAAEVEFVAVTGSPSPTGKTIILSNGGGGGMEDLGTLGAEAVTYGTAPSGWLGNPQPSGSSLTLSPATSVLPAGTHTATVEVTSQFGGNRMVAVTVRVADPVLTADIRGLSFTGLAGGSNPPAQSVSLSNTGAGDFADLGAVSVQSVTYGAGPTGWLVAPQGGSSVAGSSLAFSVSTGGVAPGTYTANVVVSSEWGGTQPVGVTLSVVRDTDPPRLALSATTMRFGALVGGDDPEPHSVFVANVGGGSLGPLQAGPPTYGDGATGWLQATLVGDSLEMTAATGPLARGSYSASLPVASANGGAESIAVTFVVGSPRLTAAPRTVSVSDTLEGRGPDPVTVSLANTGGGTFSSLGILSVEPVLYGDGASGWLTAVLSGGSLIVSAETLGLGARSTPYQALVPLESLHGGGDTVSVAFTVAPGASPARLSLSLDSLTFSGILGGEDPAPQTVIGFNAGGSILGVLSIREVLYSGAVEGWLEGSVTGTTLTFRPRLAGIPAGAHRATVRVGSENGGDLDLEAVLDVAQPILSLSSSSVSFSDTLWSPDTLRSQVFITNTGGGTRSDLGGVSVGTISYLQGVTDWLRTIPAPGETLQGFFVALEGLAPEVPEGTWVALVPVESQWGGSDTVQVSFSSRRPDRSFDLPTIELVRDTVVGGTRVTVPLPGDSMVVQAGAGSTAQIGVRVGVRNGSETRVTLSGLRVSTPTYPQGQGGGWITGAFLDRTSATFSRPAELFVAVDPGGLARGRYEGSLAVSSDAVGLEQVAPRTLRVVLVIQ
jgi:hypothetical protein